MNENSLAYLGHGIAFTALTIAATFLEINDKPVDFLWLTIGFWVWFGDFIPKEKTLIKFKKVKKMKDQHTKITGYRDLTQQEIDLMNEGKALAEQCRAFIDKCKGKSDIDQEFLSHAKTNLQQGFMWVTKSIGKPESF
jgi:hypothetical protein